MEPANIKVILVLATSFVRFSFINLQSGHVKFILQRILTLTETTLYFDSISFIDALLKYLQINKDTDSFQFNLFTIQQDASVSD